MKPEVHSNVYTMQDRLDLIAGRIDSSITKPQKNIDGKQYMLRDLALEIVQGTPQHGKKSEQAVIGRVFWWVKNNVEYRQDPADYDEYRSAGRTVNGGGSDCFTLDTKIIVRSKATNCYELRTLGELESTWPAYEALSYDFDSRGWAFKPITNWHKKENQEVWETRLATGPAIRHTPDHKVWWNDGSGSPSKRHVELRALGSALEEERPYFKRVLIAKQIPALGISDLSSEAAYLSGIYAAEGYKPSGRCHRGAYIAQDKLAIRAKIESCLDTLGIDYTQSARRVHASYYIKASIFGAWLRSQGDGSFNMRFAQEVLGGSEDLIRVALEAHGDGDGWRPKAGSVWERKAKAIHSTSCKDLADELQLMCMILGEAWHTQLQLHHGGSGNSPIHRVHRWTEHTQTHRRYVEDHPGVSYSSVRETTPIEESETVACITVADNHNFVLSNGMIVHNCDDHCILNAALLSSIGFRTGAKVISPDGQNWHIYAVVGAYPFYNPSVVIPMDTTQPNSFPGWEPSREQRRYAYQTDFQYNKALGLREVS